MWVPRLRNERGETLVTVMVAAAIGIVISLGLAGLFLNMQRGQNNVKFRADADVLNDEMRYLIGDEVACTNTFGGLNAVSGASHVITQLRDRNNNTAFNVGAVYGENTLQLQNMVLNDYRAGLTTRLATMSLVSFYRSVKESQGAQLIPRRINVALTLNAGNNIIKCVALAKMSDGIWQRSNVNNDNIYFSQPAPGGMVGIGVDAPLSAFHIESDNTGTHIRDDARVRTFESFAADAAPSYQLERARGTKAAPQPVQTGDLVGSIFFNGWNGGGFLPSANIASIAEQTWVPGPNQRANLIFSTSMVERMKITGTGDVAIGLATPQTKLHVQGAVRTDIGTVAAPALQIGDSNTGLFRPSAGVSGLAVSVNGQERARFDLNGYLGIGTTQAEAMFHITGTGAAISSNTPGTGHQFRMTRGPGNAAAFGFRFDGNSNLVMDRNWNNAWQPMLTFDRASGLLGIGTTSPPGAVLEARSVGHPFAAAFDSATGDTMVDFKNSTSGGRVWRIVSTGQPSANAIGMFAIQDTTAVVGTNRITIGANGNTGINIQSREPTDRLEVAGDINAHGQLKLFGSTVCTTMGCTASSDARLKENVTPLESSLENVLKLSGVSYDWKDKERYSKSRQVGLIAQEVEKVYPEVVQKDQRTGFLSIAYQNLVAPIIEAIRELTAEVRALAKSFAEYRERTTREMDALRKENEDIKARLLELEKKN